MSKRPIAPAVPASPCLACKQTLAAEIQAKLQANVGVLNAENVIIMECLGLADSKELTDMFFNLLIEKQGADRPCDTDLFVCPENTDLL